MKSKYYYDANNEVLNDEAKIKQVTYKINNHEHFLCSAKPRYIDIFSLLVC